MTRKLPNQVSQATLNNIAKITAELMPRPSLTPAKVEEAASKGLARKVICNLFSVAETTINDDPELLEAFLKGRATIGSQIRGKLVENALDDNSMPALLYLDKIYGGDNVVQQVEMKVSQSPLENISDAQLLEIDLNEDTDK